MKKQLTLLDILKLSFVESAIASLGFVLGIANSCCAAKAPLSLDFTLRFLAVLFGIFFTFCCFKWHGGAKDVKNNLDRLNFRGIKDFFLVFFFIGVGFSFLFISLV
jgi:hypothetical protein